MTNFKIIRRGYSQIEVDEYISRLKNDYETKLSEQKDRIFYLKDQLEKITNSSDNELVTSLVSAVERAKIIENSSKNIYELETKKLRLLYNKMEQLLTDSDISKEKNLKQELLNLIEDCRRSLQNNIIMQNENLRESTIGDPVRRLLSKMIDFNKISLDSKSNTLGNGKTLERQVVQSQTLERTVAERQPSEQQTLERQLSEKPVTQKQTFEEKQELKLEKQSPKVTIVKKQENKDVNSFNDFLSGEEELNGGNFANIMFANSKRHEKSNYFTKKDIGDYKPNDSGFDLKEAVNPTEDLDDIMKAFDFYNDDKKKK